MEEDLGLGTVSRKAGSYAVLRSMGIPLGTYEKFYFLQAVRSTMAHLAQYPEFADRNYRKQTAIQNCLRTAMRLMREKTELDEVVFRVFAQTT